MTCFPRNQAKRNLSRRSLRVFLALCIVPTALANANPVLEPGSVQEDLSVRGRLKPSGLSITKTLTTSPIPAKSKQDRSIAATYTGTNTLSAVENPPPVCSGHGNLNSISFTDWKSGLNPWTVGTESVVNPSTFDTEDWKVVTSLPDGRPGKAAFVANLDTGNCSTDDQTGLLFLQSPAIDLPVGTLVPRVSFDHWFAIELGWDGGNLKLSVNGEPFTLIPTTAIEFNTYESKLNSLADGNTNPSASQPAYTGTSDGLQGAWEQVRVNLYGLAKPGDSIRFRFDFGIDVCNGLIGWYVDDVLVYNCSDELPPSDCGNGVLDKGEQCDDGNNYIGDGCSNTCQIENSWTCTDPLPPGEVLDPGFEAGTPNPNWVEASTTFDTIICDEAACGLGIGSGPASGDYWAWFGGVETREESSLRQSVTIPSTASKLTFELEVSSCDSASDYLEVSVDDIQTYLINGSSPLCGSTGYSTQTIDISAFANDGVHSLELHAETFGTNQDVTNFFVDDIAIPGLPSDCTQTIFDDGFESN